MTQHRTIKQKNAKSNTRKKSAFSPEIMGKCLGTSHGWKRVQVYGEPYPCGFAHGWLLWEDIKHCLVILKQFVQDEFDMTYPEYIAYCEKHIQPQIVSYCPELLEEMRGIADGASRRSRSQHISVSDIIGWNSYLSLGELLDKKMREKRKAREAQRCSAFIATGKSTEKGDIVMAHNTHCHLALGAVSNIIMYVSPAKGNAFVMQTCAGLICSTMDWFLCSSGIIGCETTISGITYTPEFGVPYFCRIRKCMQHGNSLKEYADIMTTNNGGDYPCSWLFGNIHTGEIMLCELGKYEHHVETTTDGVFFGMNSAMDTKIRALQTDTFSTENGRLSINARRERLDYLLNDKYRGKINVTNAKQIIADHYDGWTNQEQKSSRGICKHSEADTKDQPVKPYGAVDGKVVCTRLAKQMTFWGRFGSSCGRIFRAKSFTRKHPKYINTHLKDLPEEPWVLIRNAVK
jgi:hypothetical protein